MSDQFLNYVQRRSSILTNRPLLKINSNSAPSLPSITSVRSPQNKKKKQAVVISSIKTRQQLMREERFRDLLKLKVNLNDLHIEHYEYRRKRYQNNIVQNDYIRGIQDKLDSFILPLKTEPKNTYTQSSSPSNKNNSQKKDFIDDCSQLQKISNLIMKKGNHHFKTKVLMMFKNMTFKQIFESIFEALQRTENPDLEKIYKSHKHLLKDIDHLFWKQLKIVSLQCGYMLDHYQKNRYKNLNQDISRIKKEMVEQGNSISRKLKQMENMPLKQGIFRSLKDLDFECLANRYFYKQLNERLEKNQQFPMIF